MLWTLPRSNPAALTCHAHTGTRFTRSKEAPLPCGTVARMLFARAYAEAGRTGDGRRLAELLSTPPRVDVACATALSACEGRQR